MNRIFSLIFLAIFVLSGCGNKKSPTGGPEDTEKPVILNVYPSEYDDIRGQDIEIVFSKQMDAASFYTGLYIYPAILAKRFKWDANTLTIKIEEELTENSNYYFSFTENIRDIHKNPLDRQYDYTWSNGTFHDNRISGVFTYEIPEDRKEDIRLTLFSADSTLIKTIIVKENFNFEALNPEAHLLRAYIDKNKNKKLDPEKDPFAEQIVPAQAVATVNLQLVYQDSTAPTIKRITPRFRDEIDILFDEDITDLHTVHIFTADSLKTPLRILRWRLKDNEAKIFTADTDTLDYSIYAMGVTDKKNNIAELDSLEYKGITKKDSISPKIVSIKPRNGSSVQSLKPEIKITFNEVIFKEDFTSWLTETETGLKYSLKIIQGDNEVFFLQPLTNLKNYNTYEIYLNVRDPRGNPLTDYEGSMFIPIVSR